MDTALPQKFPFILDRNLAKANCTGNRVCTSCDIVVLDAATHSILLFAQSYSAIARYCNAIAHYHTAIAEYSACAGNIPPVLHRHSPYSKPIESD